MLDPDPCNQEFGLQIISDYFNFERLRLSIKSNSLWVPTTHEHSLEIEKIFFIILFHSEDREEKSFLHKVQRSPRDP